MTNRGGAGGFTQQQERHTCGRYMALTNSGIRGHKGGYVYVWICRPCQRRTLFTSMSTQHLPRWRPT